MARSDPSGRRVAPCDVGHRTSDATHPKDRYVPSADRALDTAAKAAGRRTVAVVLTGMGDDGAKGVKLVKEASGTVFAQSPEDALIDGMPKNAVRAGAVDHTLPLRLLGERITRLISRD